jgi:hypothetical protein
MISNISVLNTIQDNALDVFVDADGFLNVTGCPKVKATSPKVNSIVGDNATAGVATFAFTAVNNYTYNFRVTGYDANNNLLTIPFSYTTGVSGADATSIANGVRAMITASSIGAQFASIAGTTTVVLTGTLANPLIKFFNYNLDPNMTTTAAAITTAGVEAIGLGSDLLVAYGGFIGSSAIVPTASYNQYEITVNPPVMFGGQSITEVGSTTYVVLVNKAATTGGINPIALNKDLLYGADDLGAAKTMGTITGLAKGYRVVVQSPATTAALITVTTGAITLSGGVVTFTTLAARQGDVVIISATGGTAFTTNVKSTLIGFTSATLASGDNIVAVPATAQVFKTISLRNIPS